MSLILEALRKSEAERQRAQGPGLHAPASPRPTRREAPGAGPWIAAAVGAALLAGAWWVTRTPSVPAPIEAPAPRVDTRVEAPPVAAEPAPAPVAIEPPAPAPPARRAPEPAIIEAPPRTAIEPAPRAPEPAPAPMSPPAAAEPAPAPLPGLSSLSAGERAALPPLKLSMFVWSPEPARRFAIVDGNRVGEGALLAGGTVAEIRPGGLVLDVGGRRLLVPRP
jgi:general secretion pathway protein B